METICNKLKAYLKVDFSPGMEEITEALCEMCMDLSQGIRGMKNVNEKKILLLQHLEKAKELTSNTKEKVPDFKSGLEWLNVTVPLSIHQHLKGKLVLLDFFTYCCINCMHILPDLKKLEKEFPIEDGLVVVGVHSAKFSNEKVTENIGAAVRRYEITHPVVNDSIEGMWSSLGVTCWPTQFIIGPNGEPLLTVQGEGHYETLRLFIQVALEHYRSCDQISSKQVPEISAFQTPVTSSILLFPGKMCLNSDGKMLAISDSAHHRVIIATSEGDIMFQVGSGESGLGDGDFSEARFFSPQGLCFVDNYTVIVADTENHSIRKIDLLTKTVGTLVGNGRQGHDYSGGKVGVSQEISSPWDVCFVGRLNSVFIAMAGTHQIWAYFIQNSTLWNKEYKEGVCVSVVGSGREENRNSSYPRSVGLAQPSGLSYSPQADALYFADSESSTVRVVSLSNGATSLLAGGALDPRNLFAYGDKDGVGMEAKLQHPLDIACHKSGLYIADSYNHKIKRVDPVTKQCVTIDPQNYQLNEPGGLCCSEDKLYIVDTNNHCVKVMDLADCTVKTLSLKKKESSGKKCEVVEKQDVEVSPGGTVKISVSLLLPEGVALNKEAPNSWALYYPGEKLFEEKEEPSPSVDWELTCQRSDPAVVKCRLFLCHGSTCSVKEFAFIVHITVADLAPTSVPILIKHSLHL